ncbi:ABC transporter ATP-binding protein [Paraburkholderia saeva]|uniref:ABC transporter ATP-binding protein n=1 Tax=Paraburkholderia saeva TaxID=2777537 RepID=UPI001D66CEDB|nr:ABC transporter ATP-binding protein [Paraburkholderia saeva]CAG4889342.1 Nitrate import ATP-binding protein NrtD [Paraburkholderia saeva]CAG4904165.1 Nitrate import ATP-binding protein NrtD [Paraburkholderia saeva]
MNDTPSTNAPRVNVRQVGLGYAGRRVLDGVDLDVRAGELVSVLGPSGCGKSTLLRIVAGLQHPESGQVVVDGTALRGPRPDVALAFQDPCLLPWLSVEKNVAFGLGFSRQPDVSRSARRERVTTALNQVGLAHARHYVPRQLSGGMAQRAALARCLARKPRTLLLDEPFGALDEVTRAEMQQLLVSVVRDTGAATLLVTHDIDEALLVSSRIVVLGNRGRPILQLTVDVPSPRDMHLDPLGALRIQILQALHDSMSRVALTSST